MKSVYLLEPISQEAKDWIEENINSEPWQRMGGSIAIEHSYIADVVVAMKESGLEYHTDFEVS